MLGVSWKWVAAGGLVLLGLWKGVLGSVILILYGSYTATARDTAIRRDSPDWVLRRRWAQANGLPESAVRLIGGLLVVLGAINLVSVAFMPMWVFAGLQMIAIAVIGASLVLKGLSGGTNENVVGVQQN